MRVKRSFGFYKSLTIGLLAAGFLWLGVGRVKAVVRYSNQGPASAEQSVQVSEPIKANFDNVIKNEDCTQTSLESFTSGLPTVDQNGQNPCDHSSVLGNALAGVGTLLSDFGTAANKAAKTADGKPARYYAFSGAIPMVSNSIASLYRTKPASGVEYVAYEFRNVQKALGVAPAYAAGPGLGFSALSPVIALWEMFRNIAYFFFVVVFLIVGFLIMIRSNIGAKAAVTVQEMLPKLVISLLLVTFSYAIAGFMIDVMYIAIYLIIGVFQLAGPNVDKNWINDMVFNQNIFRNSINLIGGGPVGSIASQINAMVKDILTTGFGVDDNVAKIAGGVTNILFNIVLAIAILVSMFKIFFALLQAYFGLFVGVVFAPIMLMLNALPGQNTFGAWIKNIMENLIVFPTIVLLLLIAFFFTEAIPGQAKAPANGGNSGFSAPQLFVNQGNQYQFFKNLLALGAILAMPEIIKVAKGLMQGKIGVGVEDLRKNLDKGVGPTRVVAGIGAAGGGVIAGGAIGSAVGLYNAARAPAGQRKEAFRRDALRGMMYGGGGGAIVGGALPVAQKVLGTVGKAQRDIKSLQELQKGYVEGRAADIETRAPAVPPPGAQSPGRRSPRDPRDTPVYKS